MPSSRLIRATVPIEQPTFAAVALLPSLSVAASSPPPFSPPRPSATALRRCGPDPLSAHRAVILPRYAHDTANTTRPAPTVPARQAEYSVAMRPLSTDRVNHL